MPFQRLDGTPLKGSIVALGRSGIVILCRKDVVLKIPLIYRDPLASTNKAEIEEIVAEQNCRILQNEREVYERLGHYNGIVSWSSLTSDGIEMQYMENGTLLEYLKFEKPSHEQEGNWILSLAQSIRYAHSRHVIVGDIASRNVLLDVDKSVKLCDFSDSGLIPLNMDMEKVEHNGASIRTDIFQFGSLVFEILTRQRYKYDLFDNEDIEQLRKSNGGTSWDISAIWPRPDRLPATEHLALGKIIRKCWTNNYRTMEDVCLALQQELGPLSQEERKGLGLSQTAQG